MKIRLLLHVFGLSLVLPAVLLQSGLAADKGMVDGVLTGLEQGDYHHLQVRDTKGKEHSFIVLRTDAALERWLEKPKPGQRIRVHWKMEDVPEAGEKMKAAMKVEALK